MTTTELLRGKDRPPGVDSWELGPESGPFRSGSYLCTYSRKCFSWNIFCSAYFWNRFLTTSYVVIVVLRIAQLLLLLLFSICWTNSYFVCFWHISTNAWWNSSLAWDLKSRSEHLRSKHVKTSGHDSLSSLGARQLPILLLALLIMIALIALLFMLSVELVVSG